MSEEQKTTQSEAVETTPAAPVESTETKTASGSNVWLKFVAPVVIVGVFLLGVLYLLEKEGRSKTNIFGDMIAAQEAGKTVAVVNGEEIVNAELDTSIKQFTQVAVAQGMDITNPAAQTQIRDQALEVLINTELLKQAAAERGHAVSEEDVTARITAIEEELGGAETLAERMATLDISEEQLRDDVKDELLIQMLLDDLFAEAAIEVTDEEVAEVYEIAGGEAAGLPALEEVQEQVREQIVASKEQEVIDTYLGEIREEAEIEIEGE